MRGEKDRFEGKRGTLLGLFWADCCLFAFQAQIQARLTYARSVAKIAASKNPTQKAVSLRRTLRAVMHAADERDTLQDVLDDEGRVFVGKPVPSRGRDILSGVRRQRKESLLEPLGRRLQLDCYRLGQTGYHTIARAVRRDDHGLRAEGL